MTSKPKRIAGAAKVHSLITAKPLPQQETYLGLLPGLEGNEVTTKRRQLTCERCKKGSEAEQKVGQRIAACRRKRPCGSGACPVCMKLARERIIPQAAAKLYAIYQDALKQWKATGKRKGESRPAIYSISAVDHTLSLPRGGLDPVTVENNKEALQKAIKRSPQLKGYTFFGGVDGSLNFPLDGGEPYWAPHYYLLTVGTKERLDDFFRPRFPAEAEETPRPLRITKVQPGSLPWTVSYALKMTFKGRSRYRTSDGRVKTGNSKPLADDMREFAVFLDGLGVGARFILCGLKIIKGKLIHA